jgi:hypothetical protein
VDGCLEILGLPQLHVHPNVLWEASHEQFRLLRVEQVAGVTQDRIEAICIFLDRRQEGKPGELGQSGATNRRPKAKVAKAIPGWHTLILLEGVVPYLRRASEMI